VLTRGTTWCMSAPISREVDDMNEIYTLRMRRQSLSQQLSTQ
jgi:hypothetical protein